MLEMATVFIQSQGWEYHVVARGEKICAFVEGPHTPLGVIVLVNEAERHFSVRAVPDLPVPRRKLSPILQFVSRIGRKNPVGHWEIDFENRAVMFRGDANLWPDGELTMGMVENLFRGTIAEVDRTYPLLKDLVAGTRDLQDALQAHAIVSG
jgi:hypothetical protein